MGGDEQPPLSDEELEELRQILRTKHGFVAFGAAASTIFQIGKYCFIIGLILWAIYNGHVEQVIKDFGWL